MGLPPDGNPTFVVDGMYVFPHKLGSSRIGLLFPR